MLESEKKESAEHEEKDYHFTERSYGRIQRRFALPANVDTQALKASFDNGVLTVTLPKTAEAKHASRRIPISEG